MYIQLSIAALQCDVFFAYVPTDANIADIPSRDGMSRVMQGYSKRFSCRMSTHGRATRTHRLQDACRARDARSRGPSVT
jgi:hypothetical protein